MSADDWPATAPPAEVGGVDPGLSDASDDVVEQLFDDLSELVESLKNTGALSLAVSVSEVSSKSLLIAAASRFETEFSEMFAEVAAQLSTQALASFAVNQGVTRKYHTLFDWNSGNANAFYKLLGDDFKKRAAERVESDSEFAKSVSEFVRIGSDRNKLVHSDFASFPLTETLDELIARYRDARPFLAGIRALLLEETPPAAGSGVGTPLSGP